jgi:hypothetical protein
MSAANWIALAGVGAAVVVGVAGFVANVLTQTREREHREHEADAQREHALVMARASRFFRGATPGVRRGFIST